MDRASDRRQARWLLVRGTIAALAGVACNLATLRVGIAVTSLPPVYRIEAVGPVAVPAMAAVGATALYSHLDRTAARPDAAFARWLAVGFACSLVPIAAATVAYGLGWVAVAVLTAMHLVVALVLAGVFVRRPSD